MFGTMLKIIKIAFKRKIKLLKIVRVLRFILNSSVIKVTGGRKRLPKVIQLPITTRCNSKCVMCNIPNMDSDNELTLEEFRHVLLDDIFKSVESVGINGGEPSVLSDLEDRAKIIVNTLPKLKSLNLITNGFLSNRILSNLKCIYIICRNNNVKFHISISLDGYSKIHDKVRGIEGVFAKTINVISAVKKLNPYCDSYDVACTVVKQNVYNLIELDEFCNMNEINIKYRLGISNKRIESQFKFEKFSVLNSRKTTFAAVEFFYRKYVKSSNIYTKFKYFSIYYYLVHEQSKRLLGCRWQEEGITLDPKGNIYYCAVESNKLGNLKDLDGKSLFFSKENILYRKKIISEKCIYCIHDYGGRVYIKSIMIFMLELLNRRIKFKRFKIGF